MTDLFTDSDRATLAAVAKELHDAKDGLSREVETRAGIALQVHRDARMAVVSRLLVAVVVAVGIGVGLSGLHGSRTPGPAWVNVATHDDVACIRSDIAAYLQGAVPNTLCGQPPGIPTTTGRP